MQSHRTVPTGRTSRRLQRLIIAAVPGRGTSMLHGKSICTAYNRASVSACSCTRALNCTAHWQRLLPLAHLRLGRRWRERALEV